ncbi:MAG TPA: S1/P1 nuclease [Arenimonas sp.]|nr:S1/P1 nuclease [Arenimonas sp.]
MKILVKLCVAPLLVLVSQNAFAWGATGHRTVGLIAQQHMTPAALKKSQELLEGHSLAYVASWADEIRSDPKKYGDTFNWHFTTWQDEDEQHGAGQENASTGFLLSQVSNQIAVLKNVKSSQGEKAVALKFLVHLMGDLHQPLHVGGGNDQGGNTCKVTWHGKPVNLHSVWDNSIIDGTNLSYSELADFASQNHSKEQITKWQNGNLNTWSAESKALRRHIYPAEVQTPLTPITYLTYCQKNVAPEAMPKLGYEYSYEFFPVVQERLFQAGVRLAKILNESL